jgi:hypothetical protein
MRPWIQSPTPLKKENKLNINKTNTQKRLVNCKIF